MPRKVILDANALMSPFRTSLRLEEELSRVFGACEPVVPLGVVAELVSLSKSHHEARAALALMAKRGWHTVGDSTRTRAKHDRARERGRVDEELSRLALKLNAAVVTNDRALKESLRSAGVPVAFLRSKKILEVEGVVD
jgi:hypothetical protein